MSIYKKVADFGAKYIGTDKMFKYGFNLSPMYRRSTARIKEVSKDLHRVLVKLPISYKNRNYMNSIFGGSLFSATDPIYMIQLIHILGDDYVVWDKSSEVFFKIPAKENVYAEFLISPEEIEQIKKDVEAKHEIDVVKTVFLTNKEQTKTYCEIRKTLYIAEKSFYLEKRRRRKEKRA